MTRLSILLLAAMVAGGCAEDNSSRTSTTSGMGSIETVEHNGHLFTVWDGYNAGGIIHSPSCTNHAPTVVTVTQECKYCTWARQQAGPWPTNHLRTPFTIELQDQTGGTHRITFPTNWFSTPIPVLYGRVYVTNAVEK